MESLTSKLKSMTIALRHELRSDADSLEIQGFGYDHLRLVLEGLVARHRVPWSVRLVNDSAAGFVYFDAEPVIAIGGDDDGNPSVGVSDKLRPEFQKLVATIVAGFAELDRAIRSA